MMELLVMLTIGGRQCALRAVEVDSVMEIETITRVPNAPDHVVGLSTRRSQTLTVVDCMRAAGLEETTNPIGQRAAVVEHEGHIYALLVDAIEDVEGSDGEVIAVTGGFGEHWSQLAEGMVETRRGPALLLKADRLIAGKGRIPAAA
ncbi:chemotaxis protein CheW [Altererythrobacter lutimaris]|uniref:Chemotaxis protein CheW n=1 Tax=Altererythrobacter lutimaris TaxID=2743979 RepID=A0A850HHV6_9SPHN|nr:chemotaxis protein CheW [Altererythrobacter lutimaris]NVE94872.1 chemotaxis protein CheW [Altererythrobacter lutimaris]